MRPRFQSLLVGFALLILLTAVGTTGWIALHGSRTAVKDLANRLEASLSVRIEEKLHAYLDETFRLTRYNAVNLAMPRATDQLQKTFWNQLQTFGNVSAVFIADQERQFVGVERRPDGSGVLTRAGRTTDFAFTTHTADAQGVPETLIRSQPNYDPRQRPWYRRAVEKEGAAWSDVYPFPLHKTLYLSAVQALRDTRGEPLAVVATAVSLDWINRFLGDMATEGGLNIFIIERNGLLVGGSTGEALYRDDGKLQRLNADASASPLIRATAQAALASIGAPGPAARLRQIEVESMGERHLVSVRPYSDVHGIEWLIVIAIPERTLLTEARIQETRTLVGIAAIVLIVALGSLLFARRLARPVIELNRATAQIASDRLDLTVRADGPREFVSLADSFNQMVFRLRESFDALKAANRELEGRVTERTHELVIKNRDLEHEIAERTASEVALRRERDFNLALINSLPGMFYVIDANGRFVRWNLHLEKVSGYSSTEIGRMSPWDLFKGDDRDRIAAAIAAVFANGNAEIEADFVTRSGKTIPHYFNGHRIEQEGEAMLVGMGIDISRLREAEQRVRHLASHDVLTGLPNRILLQDRLDQALATAKRQNGKLAVLFLDLDGFKRVNDDFGHRAGDEVIRDAAQRIATNVRETDSVARYGGDEFIIVLTLIEGENDIRRVTDEILRAFATPFDVTGNMIDIGISIGAALFPDHAVDSEGLIQRADAAMYRAKDDGKGRLEIAGS